MRIAEKLYTPQDLLNDSSLGGYELVAGHLRERGASARSSSVGVRIASLLANEAVATRIATVFGSNLGYHCFHGSDHTIRFSNVTLVRNVRMEQFAGDVGFMPIPADLAVEVLSPNDVVSEVDDKVKQYLGAGFGLVWDANPRWSHVHVYRPDGTVQLFSESEEISDESALPSFRSKVAAFFDL